MSTETERAWAAGFFDGEGWVGRSLVKKITNGNVYICERVDCGVSQNDPEVLERFLKAVGVGNIGGPYKRKKENQADFWMYRACNRKSIQQIFAEIGPYLSTIKVTQFEEALKREPRFCIICNSEIDIDKNLRTKYCGPTCRNAAKNNKISL